MTKHKNRNLYSEVPRLIKTDSYKAGHFRMYQPHRYMTAYMEARKGYPGMNDNRIVHAGIQYSIDNFLTTPITMNDIQEAEEFYNTHGVMRSPYPWPRDLLVDAVKENGGYIPIKVRALKEGTVILARTPQVVFEAEGKYSRLVTFYETAMMEHVWYMSTVATLSRHCKEMIRRAFDKTVDPENFWKLQYRLHDFGYRGTTCGEQAMIGGFAHLYNFDGTDTMPAAWYSRQLLSKGVPNFDCSIPATEHSVMCSWPTELEAVQNMIENFGDGTFATVADTYNYDHYLATVLPVAAPVVKAMGGYMVVRPDSGDPVECVLKALRAAAKHFGYTTNRKGFMVINNAGVIQGDGIDISVIGLILDAVIAAGFSVENVAFGMGGGLLQKVNRDTMSYAMKLSLLETEDGTIRNIMKAPATDMGKSSFPGSFSVYRQKTELSENLPVIHRLNSKNEEDQLITYWDSGPIEDPRCWESVDKIRSSIDLDWGLIDPRDNPISKEVQEDRETEYNRIQDSLK